MVGQKYNMSGNNAEGSQPDIAKRWHVIFAGITVFLGIVTYAITSVIAGRTYVDSQSEKAKNEVIVRLNELKNETTATYVTKDAFSGVVKKLDEVGADVKILIRQNRAEMRP